MSLATCIEENSHKQIKNVLICFYWYRIGIKCYNIKINIFISSYEFHNRCRKEILFYHKLFFFRYLSCFFSYFIVSKIKTSYLVSLETKFCKLIFFYKNTLLFYYKKHLQISLIREYVVKEILNSCMGFIDHKI